MGGLSVKLRFFAAVAASLIFMGGVCMAQTEQGQAPVQQEAVQAAQAAEKAQQEAAQKEARITALTDRLTLLQQESLVLQEKKELLLVHKKFVVELEEVDKMINRLGEEIGVLSSELAAAETEQIPAAPLMQSETAPAAGQETEAGQIRQ